MHRGCPWQHGGCKGQGSQQSWGKEGLSGAESKVAYNLGKALEQGSRERAPSVQRKFEQSKVESVEMTKRILEWDKGQESRGAGEPEGHGR